MAPVGSTSRVPASSVGSTPKKGWALNAGGGRRPSRKAHRMASASPHRGLKESIGKWLLECALPEEWPLAF
eukprot:3039298-Pyramimonas_sp.AAC.1